MAISLYEKVFKSVDILSPINKAAIQLRIAECMGELNEYIEAWKAINISLESDPCQVKALLFRSQIVQNENIGFIEIALDDLNMIKELEIEFPRIDELITLVKVRIASRRLRCFY